MKRKEIGERLISLSGEISPDYTKGTPEARCIAIILGTLGLCFLKTKSGNEAFLNYLNLVSREILKNTPRFRGQGGD